MQTVPEPSPAAIRQQLELIRRSAAFTGSDRLFVLLRHLVGETLEDRAPMLKEAAIGHALYQRDPPYDPRIDSTVRVEMRRLRRKLQEHFAQEGRGDPVAITIPTGGYVPVFALNAPPAMDVRGERRDIFHPGPGTIILVLPIRSIPEDAAAQNCAERLTDELIFVLGSEPGIRVPSRRVTYSATGDAVPLQALAAEFGAAAVLQGALSRTGDAIRVNVEVANSRGIVVASDQFEDDIANSDDLPDRIAATLASRLRFDSSKMRASRISPSLAAVDCHAQIYRARHLLDGQTPERLREALSIFTEVAGIAPDYARGHSGVADCCCDLFRLGLIDTETARARAGAALDQALEIDPDSVEAHAALGTVRAWLDRDRSGAEARFERALERGGNARAARVYGSYLALLGRMDEAERLFREARRIEPFSHHQDIAEAVSRFQARAFDRLTGAQSPANRRNPSHEALYYTALANHFGGDDAAADSAAKPLAHLLTAHPLLVFADAEIEAWLGRPARARQLLAMGNQKASPFAHAALAAATGDAALTLDHLDAALGRRELATVWLRTDSRFDFLHGHDRFRAMLARLDALRLS